MGTQCEREIRRQVLDEMIAEVERSIEQFRKTLDGLQQRIAAETRQRELLEQKRNALVQDANKKDESLSIADYVAKILFERGQPMRVQEIVHALNENGITSNARQAPLNSVLSAVSRRADLFERVSRGKYVLRRDRVKRSPSIASHRPLAATH